MKKKIIKEGKAEVEVYVGDKISKDLTVFYNPVMKFNRDMTISILNSISNKNMQIASPLAGSGVREVRMMLELPKNKIKKLAINDYNNAAVKSIKKNLKLNKINSPKLFVSQKDANEFIISSTGFDYIDIDPFGSPNPFLDSAMKRISRDGILAVTATDAAPLSGTYPKTCKRKYWAKPLRNEQMHEIGLRILIRKVQLIGAQYEKALVPIFSYFKDHYFRVFFRVKKLKTACDEILNQHKYFIHCTKCLDYYVSDNNIGECCDKKMDYAGPLWVGGLFNNLLVSKMLKKSDDKFVGIIAEESKIETVGFFDIHKICKKYKLALPKTDDLMKRMKVRKFKVSRTHFSPYGLRTNAKLKEILEFI